MRAAHYLFDARTATAHFPGIGRYVRNLATAMAPLLAADEQLSILWNPVDPAAWNPAPLASNQVSAIPAPISPFSLGQQWQMPRLLRQTADRCPGLFPIYHSTYYLMPYCPGMPTVLTIYDLIAMLYPQTVSARARLLFRLTTRLAVWSASAIITISEATRHDLRQHFGADPARLTTIPLAADPRFRPQPAAAIEMVRRKYSLPDHYLFYLGINKPHKNLERLIEAYTQLAHTPSAEPLAPLVIAGAWDDRYAGIREHLKTLQIENAIRFLGPIDDADLPALYSGCTLFVFPSIYEGFGLPVLEAMACGAPVACSSASSLPEITGEAALLFDPFSVDAIANALRQAMADEAMRHRLAGRSLQQAAQFTWQRTAQATLHLYRRLHPDGYPG